MRLWVTKPTVPRFADNITFAVDAVSPATTRLPEETLFQALTRRIDRPFVTLPEAELPVVAEATLHPLIEAVHRAFSEHRPLILSPDDIWLTVVQGFAHHVVENAEVLRHKLVSFEGKRELAVPVLSFPTEIEWPSVIELWSASVREYVPLDLYNALVCNFSTTTPAIRTASEVAVLDAFQQYFEYTLVCVCGIPKVTLRGTPDDWRSIRKRVEKLDGYGLDHWTRRLRPIMDKLVRTAEGHPDVRFWQAIYKPAQAYGGEVATGWITDLFPYLERFGDRYPNDTLRSPRIGWALHPFVADRANGIAPSAFPSGLSSAQVVMRIEDTTERFLEILAGFFGIIQSPEGELSPHIGWSIIERDAIDVFWNKLSERFPSKPSVKKENRIASADFSAFRKRFSEMIIFPGTSHEWKIVPGATINRRIWAPDVFALGPDNLIRNCSGVA
jgi:Domain of unknown function (DUF4419)